MHAPPPRLAGLHDGSPARSLAHDVVKSQVGVDRYVSVVREGKIPRDWRLCAGCSAPVKADWTRCPKCETPKPSSPGALTAKGWARCRKRECAAPVRCDWQVCPTCGTGVPIVELGRTDWVVCQECKNSLLRPDWHICPGCGAPAPLRRAGENNPPRLPLLSDQKAPTPPGSTSSYAAADSEREFSPEFLLSTTPRYWDKKIREMETKRGQSMQSPQANPYATPQRFTARPGEVMQGWKGPSRECIPASLDSLHLYERPYPRKNSSLKLQNSMESTWSSSSPRSTRCAMSPERSPPASPAERYITRQNSSVSSLYSNDCIPREHSYTSASDWSSANLRRQSSSYSISSERRHLLDGHSAPGKLWRENSTFRELAIMRLSVEVQELAGLHDERLVGDIATPGLQGQGQRKALQWDNIHQQSMQRQNILHEQISGAMMASDFVEDLLEVRRDGRGSWYLPHGKCLHWWELQARLEAEKSALAREFDSFFGERSVMRKWYRLSKNIIHKTVARRLNVLKIEYNVTHVIWTQNCARRFLRKKRARERRAAMWAARHKAATLIQSIARLLRDIKYCRTVKKCTVFLGQNRNIFVAHKAFVRAKRAYTGTIEPPFTAAAFANMGDAPGAAEYENATLSFVEYCKVLTVHLQKVASCPDLARTTSSAILRVSSGEKSSVVIKRSQSLERMLSAMAPFEQEQEELLHIAEATARLFYLHDKDHLGVLSEGQFWRFRRELSLSTGVEICRDDTIRVLRSVLHIVFVAIL